MSSHYDPTLKIEDYNGTKFVSRVVPLPGSPEKFMEVAFPAERDPDYQEMLQKTLIAADIFAAASTGGKS